MATLAQIRTHVDNALAALWPKVQTWEANYFAAHGRYWQGVRNPIITPADDNEASLDLSLRPTDQAESWLDANVNLTLAATYPMSIEIHVHDGPLGKGYTGVVTVQVLGNIYQRAQGIGPHSFTFPWAQLVPGA